MESFDPIGIVGIHIFFYLFSIISFVVIVLYLILMPTVHFYLLLIIFSLYLILMSTVHFCLLLIIFSTYMQGDAKIFPSDQEGNNLDLSHVFILQSNM